MRRRTFYPKEWAVIAYARLSDEERENTNEEKRRCIESQKRYLELCIDAMRARGEIVKRQTIVFEDGRTGAGAGRMSFQDVIELLREKKYNCLIISELSRGFRSITDQTYYLEEYFPLHEIRFISTMQQYVDSYLVPESAMYLGEKLPGATSEQLAYDTSVKVRSTFDLKRKMGEFIGAFAPFGYEKSPINNDRLIVDDAAAMIVRDIFTWYVGDGMSLGAVARKLNELGVPNPTKYKNQRGQRLKSPQGNDGLWSASSVRRLLTNEVYLGKMVQGREEIVNYKVHKARRLPKEEWYIVDGMHEPIVDTDTFERAQQLLTRNSRAGKRGSVYPLGGILKCGECKKAMSRKTSKGRSYYGCRTYREKGKQFCWPHTIREDVLFDTLLEAINLQILQLGDKQELLQRIHDARVKPQDIVHLEHRLAQTEGMLENEMAVFDRTYYDMVKGKISEEQYLRIRELCETRQTQLRELITMLSKEIESTRTVKTKPASLALFQKSNRLSELTRTLACDLIESVYVYKDKSVEINFRFADQIMTADIS